MNDKQVLKNRLYKVLEPQNLIELFENSTRQKPFVIKKGTYILNNGQPIEKIFVIKKGFAKLCRVSDEGRETITYLLGPGYVVGARAFLDKEECASYDAISLTEMEIIYMSHIDYLDVLSKNPQSLVDLLQVFINRLIYTENKLEGFIIGNTTARVANFLLDTYERFGETDCGKKILPLTLTHQQIAEFVGAIRETVTVSLNLLQKDEIIRLNEGKIEIRDIKKLITIARPIV